MSDDAESPLTFATTDELIDELSRRSDALVIAALFKTDDRDDSQGMTFRYTGNLWTALGLLSHSEATLQQATHFAGDDDS